MTRVCLRTMAPVDQNRAFCKNKLLSVFICNWHWKRSRSFYLMDDLIFLPLVKQVVYMSVFCQLRRVSFFLLHNWLNYKVHPLFSKSLPSLQFQNPSSSSMIWIAATAFWSFLPGLVFLWPITFTALIVIFIKHSSIQKLYWKFILLLE